MWQLRQPEAAARLQPARQHRRHSFVFWRPNAEARSIRVHFDIADGLELPRRDGFQVGLLRLASKILRRKIDRSSATLFGRVASVKI